MNAANDSTTEGWAGRLERVVRAWLANVLRFVRSRGGTVRGSGPATSGMNRGSAAGGAMAGGAGASDRETGIAWSWGLEQEKGALVSLVRGMEREFLATGEGLGCLARLLGGIQTDCEALADLTLGRSPEAGVQFAFQLLKKAEDLLLASYEQYDFVFATFGELQRELSRLRKQHDQLMRVLLPLNFIATSFRVEASRHPGKVEQAFCTLAANVKLILNEFRGTVEEQFEELAASEVTARGLLQQIAETTRKHRQGVASTLAASRDHLRALGEALVSSGAGAADLSRLSQAVTRQIGDLVMVQQCQDITRQKIEHVGEAMDELREHLEDPVNATPAGEAETRKLVFHAGQIQLRQVQDVFDELNRAADSLRSGMENLRGQAGAAAAMAVKVGETSLDDKVGRRCQASIGGILEVVEQSLQRIADILAAFEPLQQSFVHYTHRATELATDVWYAALNAQIFAGNAPDGATLEVMARCLRLISEEAIENLEQLEDALQHSADLVNNLRLRLVDFRELSQIEQRTLSEETELSRSRLADLERAVPERVERIMRQQRVFARAVHETLVQIRFPATVAEAGPRSIRFLQRLVAWGGAGQQELEAGSETALKIDRLKSNYTMASERATHAMVLQAAVPRSQFPVAPLPTGTAGPSKPRPSEPAAGGPISSGPSLVETRSTVPTAISPEPPGVASGGDLGANVELF